MAFLLTFGQVPKNLSEGYRQDLITADNMKKASMLKPKKHGVWKAGAPAIGIMVLMYVEGAAATGDSPHIPILRQDSCLPQR